AQLDAERGAAPALLLDERLGLDLRLGVIGARRRKHERAAPVEVQLLNLVGLPEMEVYGPGVDGRERALRLDEAEQLAGLAVDDREAVHGRSEERRVGEGGR